MRIVVVGGTGRVGSPLCALLTDAGHEPVAAAPSTGVDTVTGVGLTDTLRGARAVVDVSNPRAGDDQGMEDFFRTSTRNLLAAEEADGVEHHVTLSIVGCDLVPGSGYLAAKAVQERILRDGSVPYTILRATQFFEFIGTIVEAASDGDRVRLPPARIQPVAAADVASALAELVEGAPEGATLELAGPEAFRMDELGRRFLSAKGDRRQVVTDPEATYFGARLGTHTLVPQGGARLGRQRLDDWLAGPESVPHDG